MNKQEVIGKRIESRISKLEKQNKPSPSPSPREGKNQTIK
jgi:hypothetical protein